MHHVFLQLLSMVQTQSAFLLKKLEQKGFLSRERSTEDERNLVVSITEKGTALREQALEIPKKMGDCLGLSAEETKTFYGLIYKVLLNVEKDLSCR